MNSSVVWSRRIADELWSGLVTPLTFSLLAEPMAEHMVRRRLVHAGFPELAGEQVFLLERGHVFVNASLVARVMEELPSVVVTDGLLELLPEELRGGLRRHQRALLGPQTIGTVARLTWNERGWMPWTRGGMFRTDAALVRSDLATIAAVEGASAEELRSVLDRIRQRLGRYLEIVSWGMIYAYVFFHLLQELLNRWAPEVEGAAAALLGGTQGIRTFEAHEEVLEAARFARRDPGIVRLFEEHAATEIADRCMRSEMGVFGDRLIAILKTHGHRLVARDLAHPTWAERPEVVVDMIGKLLVRDAGSSAEEREKSRAELRDRVEARLSQGAGGLARQALFHRALAWCQEYYALRENMRYHADMFLSALRRVALASGTLLHAGGRLEEPGHVFHLTCAELVTALDDDRTSFADEAAVRCREYVEFGRTPPPLTLGAGPVPTQVKPARATLSGLGVSPGVANGPARVVRNVQELGAIQRGEVIVAPATDPTWTSLLALGGGLVLEAGGLLSHGAIVARELGIPAVVDVPAVMERVATGDAVEIDGEAGTVEIRPVGP